MTAPSRAARLCPHLPHLHRHGRVTDDGACADQMRAGVRARSSIRTNPEFRPNVILFSVRSGSFQNDPESDTGRRDDHDERSSCVAPFLQPRCQWSWDTTSVELGRPRCHRPGRVTGLAPPGGRLPATGWCCRGSLKSGALPAPAPAHHPRDLGEVRSALLNGAS